MLKPHLHTLVKRSLELALKSKEPFNYFLLLRALFRSIGGGNHDLLYQEFLPLLSILLQSLNELQTGLHKQHLKDLFVELCLTVPVRLSSLLPFLPLLMDPLVSALNGSQTLVSQGLRTLELCVDNLQPDFLYDHIQPVRTDLIQGLWRTLRSNNDTNAQTAFRVLGKLGGNNRKMMIEPQKLKYNTNINNCKEFNGPTIKITFPNYTSNIELSLEKVFESCQNVLKVSSPVTSTILNNLIPSHQIESSYKKHAYLIVNTFISSLISNDDDQKGLFNTFFNYKPLNPTNTSRISSYEILIQQLKTYRFDDEYLRQSVESALTCLFYATSVKEIRKSAISYLDTLVSHFTLLSLALLHQSGNTVSLSISGYNYIDFFFKMKIVQFKDKTYSRPQITI
jgi:transformation/transcription domain-associated protein